MNNSLKDLKPRLTLFCIAVGLFILSLLGCLHGATYFIIPIIMICSGALICSSVFIVFEIIKLFKIADDYLNYVNRINDNYEDIDSTDASHLSNPKLSGTKLAQSISEINLSILKDEDRKSHIIICKGYASAVDCSLFLNKSGYSWQSGDSYLDNVGWHSNEIYIGYIFNKGTFIRFNTFNEVNWDNYFVHFWLNKPEESK